MYEKEIITLQSITPIIPQFINDLILESEQKNINSFGILNCYESAEKHYGKLSYQKLFYVNEMIKLAIESNLLIQKGNMLYYDNTSTK